MPKPKPKQEYNPLEGMDISPQLGNTLEHIVKQLDSLTENVKLIEGKMTQIEEKADKNQIIMNQRIQKMVREESNVKDDEDEENEAGEN